PEAPLAAPPRPSPAATALKAHRKETEQLVKAYYEKTGLDAAALQKAQQFARKDVVQQLQNSRGIPGGAAIKANGLRAFVDNRRLAIEQLGNLPVKPVGPPVINPIITLDTAFLIWGMPGIGLSYSQTQPWNNVAKFDSRFNDGSGSTMLRF